MAAVNETVSRLDSCIILRYNMRHQHIFVTARIRGMPKTIRRVPHAFICQSMDSSLKYVDKSVDGMQFSTYKHPRRLWLHRFLRDWCLSVHARRHILHQQGNESSLHPPNVYSALHDECEPDRKRLTTRTREQFQIACTCSALFRRVCGAVYTHFRTTVYQSVNETKQHEYNINKEGCHAVTASTGIEVVGDEHLWTVCRVVLWPGCEKGTMILNESWVCPAIQAPLGLFIYGDIGYILTPWILSHTLYLQQCSKQVNSTRELDTSARHVSIVSCHDEKR